VFVCGEAGVHMGTIGYIFRESTYIFYWIERIDVCPIDMYIYLSAYMYAYLYVHIYACICA
jgi:hypothetical protein